jgi:hypothetical protein
MATDMREHGGRPWRRLEGDEQTADAAEVDRGEEVFQIHV